MYWMIKHPIWTVLITLFTIGIIGSGNGTDSSDHYHQVASSTSQRQIAVHKPTKVATSVDKNVHKSHHRKPRKNEQHSNNQLSRLNYHSGEAAYQEVNSGRSTLNPKQWRDCHIQYADLDSLNRTSYPVTAYLDSANVVNDSLRQEQTVYPTGWHQKFINRQAIINRGHLIAYSLSKGIDTDGNYQASDVAGDQNNLKNLFTQTAFSNQRLQTIYETKVRDALLNGERVIYQVQPIFRGNDLMARGVHLQALSTDSSLNFNVYLFNVQPGISFNYSTGTSQIDHSMNVPTPDDAPVFRNYNRGENKTIHHYYHPYRHYWHHSYYRWHHSSSPDSHYYHRW